MGIEPMHSRFADDRVSTSPRDRRRILPHLASKDKRVLWVNGSHHALAVDDKRGLIYKAIYRFVAQS